MKVCYFDESGTGQEPIAVMVGVVVDSQRMHVTKDHWSTLLDNLSQIAGKKLQELHTKDFYVGSGPFRGLSGSDRAAYISEIMGWFCERKHAFVYSAVDKQVYQAAYAAGQVPPELKTPWLSAAFHTILALQRANQGYEKTKGHTLLVFDHKGHDEEPLAELVSSPPPWSDAYYSRNKKQQPLSHIIDSPYFVASHRVPLIQVADFLAYFLRRYAELQADTSVAKYAEEEQKISQWVSTVASRAISANHIYPARGRCKCADTFNSYCPESLRRLGS